MPTCQWMWADANATGRVVVQAHALAKLNPYRWSSKKSVTHTIAEFEDMSQGENADRPICLKIWDSAGEHGLPYANAEGAIVGLQLHMDEADEVEPDVNWPTGRWMWAAEDAAPSGLEAMKLALKSRNPLRWSTEKAVERVSAELDGCVEANRDRPVLVRLKGGGMDQPLHPHELRQDAQPRNECDICARLGTSRRCSAGCDFDLCESCWASAYGSEREVRYSDVPSAVLGLEWVLHHRYRPTAMAPTFVGMYSEVVPIGGVPAGVKGGAASLTTAAPKPRCVALMPGVSQVRGVAATVTGQCPVQWRYQPHNGRSMDIRAEPSSSGPRTKTELLVGEVFGVSQTVLRDGITFLCLSDGRGWVYDKDSAGELCMPVADEDKLWWDPLPASIAGARMSVDFAKPKDEKSQFGLGHLFNTVFRAVVPPKTSSMKVGALLTPAGNCAWPKTGGFWERIRDGQAQTSFKGDYIVSMHSLVGDEMPFAPRRIEELSDGWHICGTHDGSQWWGDVPVTFSTVQEDGQSVPQIFTDFSSINGPESLRGRLTPQGNILWADGMLWEHFEQKE